MKAIIYQGPEPKIIEDEQRKYLLFPAGCNVRVLDIASLQEVPDGYFLSTERFWAAIAKVFGIVVTDGKVFRGDTDVGHQNLVMRLAGELGYALYVEDASGKGSIGAGED